MSSLLPSYPLEGDRIVLRLLTEYDCTETYLSWMRDPQIVKYLESNTMRETIETLKDYVKSMNSSNRNYLFGIFLKQDMRHIGNIKLGNIEYDALRAEVGYIIGESSAWGRGYASEAVGLVLAFGFRRLGLKSLEAGSYEENTGSIRILEKFGFLEQRRIVRGDNGKAMRHFKLFREDESR